MKQVESVVVKAEAKEEKETKKVYKKEKVCEATVPYDNKYVYYLDKRGNVYRSPRSVGHKRLRRREKVLELDINKKPNHLYYVNSKGEIWSVEMNQGGVVGAKKTRAYVSAALQKKAESDFKEVVNSFDSQITYRIRNDLPIHDLVQDMDLAVERLFSVLPKKYVQKIVDKYV
jgi:hypothetical protein